MLNKDIPKQDKLPKVSQMSSLGSAICEKFDMKINEQNLVALMRV